jgi:hypothetical protein
VFWNSDEHSFDRVVCLVADATCSPVWFTLPLASGADSRRDVAPLGGTMSV